MNIQEAIRADLVANADILAHVSTRVYYGERPQNSALPAITIEEIGGGESFQDMTAGTVGVAIEPFQINCWAATPDAALAIREHVKIELQNHIHALMGGAGGVHVWACIFRGKSAGYDPVSQTYAASIDFDVIHRESSS
jgi:hypothetical protein